MHDQANALRGLMERRAKSSLAESAHFLAAPSQVITITSGKGGVGKSNVALNLAIALAESDQSVLLIDVNWGVGNIEFLCGINSPWNFSHVVNGARRLDEVLVDGPAGVTILPGAGSLGDHIDNPLLVEQLLQELKDLQQQYRFVIVDLGSGLHRVLQQFVNQAHRVLIVTTAEPPSMAEAYSTIKTLSSTGSPVWEVLINQAESLQQAEALFQRLSQTAQTFASKHLELAGWIPQDSSVPAAVLRRKPLLLEHPYSAASEAISHMARRLLEHANSTSQRRVNARNVSDSALTQQNAVSLPRG